MHSDLCLVMDQGSQSSRAMIFDRFGNCLSQAQVRIKIQLTPPNRAEQSPEQILISLKRAALESISKLNSADRRRLKSASLITQRSSTLCWDADTGEPLTPVISWQDRRGVHYLEELAPLAPLLRQLTGLYPNAHLPASKLRWCLEHNNFSKALHRIKGGPIAAWLIKNLLHEQTDQIDGVTAARTMLYSINDKSWHPELLELFQIPESLLPDIKPCQHNYGNLKLPGCELPLTFVSGDQAAALFAFGTPSPENLYINLGSGGFLNRILDTPGLQPQERLLHHTILAARQPLFSAEATINGAANALEWAFNICRPHSRQLDKWQTEYPDPPLFMNMVGGVGSPDWCPIERSCWIGEEEEPKARLVGVMESIIFLILRNIEAMSALPPPEQIIIGGGISQLNSLCQGLADLSGLPVLRYKQQEITAMGAAWLTLNNSIRQMEPEQRFTPKTNTALKQRYRNWSKAFNKHLDEVRDEL